MVNRTLGRNVNKWNLMKHRMLKEALPPARAIYIFFYFKLCAHKAGFEIVHIANWHPFHCCGAPFNLIISLWICRNINTNIYLLSFRLIFFCANRFIIVCELYVSVGIQLFCCSSHSTTDLLPISPKRRKLSYKISQLKNSQHNQPSHSVLFRLIFFFFRIRNIDFNKICWSRVLFIFIFTLWPSRTNEHAPILILLCVNCEYLIRIKVKLRSFLIRWNKLIP